MGGWRAERMPGGWRVLDSTDRRLVYIYSDDRPAGVNEDKLTLDEARRIAAQIARLPELLKPRG